jgi:hypothetical protein
MIPKGFISQEAVNMIGCFFVIGLIATSFLIGWGICALVRWIF